MLFTPQAPVRAISLIVPAITPIDKANLAAKMIKFEEACYFKVGKNKTSLLDLYFRDHNQFQKIKKWAHKNLSLITSSKIKLIEEMIELLPLQAKCNEGNLARRLTLYAGRFNGQQNYVCAHQSCHCQNYLNAKLSTMEITPRAYSESRPAQSDMKVFMTLYKNLLGLPKRFNQDAYTQKLMNDLKNLLN